MPQVTSTDRPVWWAVRETGSVVAAGQTEPGGVTLTGLELISADHEVLFLAAVAGSAGSYRLLPSAGEWLTSGDIYRYGTGLVIVRQSHTRTLDAPDTVPALFAVYRPDADAVLPWVPNEQVYVGTERTYQGATYRCLQAHFTLANQYPSAVGVIGVLWVLVPTTAEWAVGVLYHVNDEVTYQGATYRCLQQHTSIANWYPPAVGVINVLWVLVP